MQHLNKNTYYFQEWSFFVFSWTQNAIDFLFYDLSFRCKAQLTRFTFIIYNLLEE